MSIADDIANYIQKKKEWGTKKDRLESAYKSISVQKKEYDSIVHSGGFDIGGLKWTGDTAKEFRNTILERSMEESKKHYQKIDRVHDGLNKEIKEASNKSSYFNGLLSRAYRELKTGTENIFN